MIKPKQWRESLYHFPPNNRAVNTSLYDQLKYTEDEAIEALNAEKSEHVIEELWDVIQAAEGALRKFPEDAVRKGRARVKIKCQQRGNYD